MSLDAKKPPEPAPTLRHSLVVVLFGATAGVCGLALAIPIFFLGWRLWLPPDAGANFLCAACSVIAGLLAATIDSLAYGLAFRRATAPLLRARALLCAVLFGASTYLANMSGCAFVWSDAFDRAVSPLCQRYGPIVLLLALGPSLVFGLLAASAFGFLTLPICRAPGLCRRCGYNLTGNVSGRCPECGTELAHFLKGASRAHGD